jgi:hypothetical protein
VDRRLRGFLAAGLVDSFAFAFGWTVFVLLVVAEDGFRAAALCNGALLVGAALSAPVTERLAALLDGRSLIRSTALFEGTLRVGIFVALLQHAPVALLAVGVLLMSTAAWCGFAAMRAEAASAGGGVVALTWYAVGIGSIEAAGTACGALLLTGSGRVLTGTALWAVVGLYAASLVPTLLVAHYALRPRAARARSLLAPVRRLARPLTGGFGVMLVGSGLTLLAVPLAATLYGPIAVAASAAAFAAGALLAPFSAGALERARAHDAVLWPVLGAVMVAGWFAAPVFLGGLLAAQFLSGYGLTAFEGAMDARVAAMAEDGAVASNLAYASASRALGSSAAVTLTPLFVAASAIGWIGTGETIVLMGAAGVALLARSGRLARAPSTA